MTDAKSQLSFSVATLPKGDNIIAPTEMIALCKP